MSICKSGNDCESEFGSTTATAPPSVGGPTAPASAAGTEPTAGRGPSAPGRQSASSAAQAQPTCRGDGERCPDCAASNGDVFGASPSADPPRRICPALITSAQPASPNLEPAAAVAAIGDAARSVESASPGSTRDAPRVRSAAGSAASAGQAARAVRGLDASPNEPVHGVCTRGHRRTACAAKPIRSIRELGRATASREPSRAGC